MKKIKLAIMTAAILLSVGGALAVRANTDCTFATQYYLSGSSYLNAGIYGTDFFCEDGTGTCTYWLTSSGYAQCRMGVFLNAKLVNKANDQKKK